MYGSRTIWALEDLKLCSWTRVGPQLILFFSNFKWLLNITKSISFGYFILNKSNVTIKIISKEIRIKQLRSLANQVRIWNTPLNLFREHSGRSGERSCLETEQPVALRALALLNTLRVHVMCTLIAPYYIVKSAVYMGIHYKKVVWKWHI